MAALLTPGRGGRSPMMMTRPSLKSAFLNDNGTLRPSRHHPVTTRETLFCSQTVAPALCQYPSKRAFVQTTPQVGRA